MPKKINLDELQQTAETLKNYIDSLQPNVNRYTLIKEITLNCNQNNIALKANSGSKNYEFTHYNFENVITNELPEISFIKITAKVNNTDLIDTNRFVDNRYIPQQKIYADKATNLGSYAFYTDNDRTDVSKRIGLGMINLNAKRDTTSGKTIYTKNSITLYYTTLGITPSLLDANGVTITLQFYKENNDFVGYKYNYPYNLFNGEGINSLQGVGSTAKGDYSLAIGFANDVSGNNNISLGSFNKSAVTDSVTIGMQNNVYEGTSLVIGNKNTINNSHSLAIGNGLTVDGFNRETAGNMIIGQGGTLAKDSLFAISTALNSKNAAGTILPETVRYPFEVKKDNTVYLRGSNLILETDNEPSQDNHLITKKYVDSKIGGSATSLTSDPDIYLTKDKYQYVTGVNTVDNLIWLPSTDMPAFLKIRLYAINCKMKSTFDNAVKWKNGQNPASGKFEMTANNIYEFVLTYINGSWIGEFITYDNA